MNKFHGLVCSTLSFQKEPLSQAHFIHVTLGEAGRPGRLCLLSNRSLQQDCEPSFCVMEWQLLNCSWPRDPIYIQESQNPSLHYNLIKPGSCCLGQMRASTSVFRKLRDVNYALY